METNFTIHPVAMPDAFALWRRKIPYALDIISEIHILNRYSLFFLPTNLMHVCGSRVRAARDLIKTLDSCLFLFFLFVYLVTSH